MAETNFGILDTQLPGRIAAIPQQAQAQQTQNMLTALQAQQTMRQGEVSQMQLQKMKQSEAALEKIRQTAMSLGGPSDLRTIANAYLSSGDPEHMKYGVSLVKELDQQDRFKSIMRGPANMPQPAPAPMGAAPAGANNLASKVQGLPSNVLDMQQKRNQLIELGTPQAIAMAAAIEKNIELEAKPFMHNVPGVGTVDAMGRTIIPAVEPKGELVKEYEYAKKQGFTGTLFQFKQQLANAGRAPAQPRPEQPAQAVVDPDTGTQILVSREEAIRRRMTPAQSDTKPLTAQQQLRAKETQVAQNGVVKSANTAAKELETLADNLLGNPDKKIQPNPGLGGITGYRGLMPSFPNTAARSAQQQLDTFKGKVMAFGRLLATQQGKLGNMAVSEWKFISDAVEKIDPLANNFDTQLRDVVRQAKDFAAAKSETFDELYDSTTAKGGASGSTGKWGTAVPE
jgi:hypothetical protein